MDQFSVIAKHYPTGQLLDLGEDFNSLSLPATFERQAPHFVASKDGTQTYPFMFWNTGRHVTNYRRARWNFNVGGWGHWTATAWYGTAPVINDQRIHVDGFSIGADALIKATAIDPAASIFGSGMSTDPYQNDGAPYPWNGNIYEILNETTGGVTVVVKNPLDDCFFEDWQYVFQGGDDSATFNEDDAGAKPGTPGFFGQKTPDPIVFGSFSAADILIKYGNSSQPVKSTPLPFPAGATLALASIIQGAAQMSAAELEQARESVQANLELSRAALDALQAQSKRSAG